MKRWLPFAVAGVLLACYWLTLAPSLTEGDSGELATAVHVMGVPHPTGYPLYMMAGKLFDLLPLGEPARRVAFFSAVSAATAGGSICWMLLVLTGSGAAGVLGGLVFGLNRWVWSQANIVEVYALHVLLVCLLLGAFVRFLNDPGPLRLEPLVFLCGVALTHHRTSVFFFAPPLLWAVLRSRPWSARLLARSLALAFLPLLLYLWLPFRSASGPPVNWGNTSGGLAFFFGHINGSAYLRYAFAETPARALDQTVGLFKQLWWNLGPAGIVLAVAGAFGMVRSPRQRPFGASLAVSFAAVLLWASFYLVPDKDVFYAPALIPVAMWCGGGVAFLVSLVHARRPGPGLARAVSLVAAAAAVLLPFDMARKNWSALDRSQQYQHLEVTAAGLCGVPASAVVLLRGDVPNGAALYYYNALRRQPPPLVLSVNRITWPWYEMLLDPSIREAVVLARSTSPSARLPWLVSAIRERLDPGRAVYTNVPLMDPPAGYVVLRDYALTRLVPSPGIPEAADSVGARNLLELPGGAGSLLGIDLPHELTRGEPFPLVVSVRWNGRVPPEGSLMVLFSHSEVSEQQAPENHEAAFARFMMVRPTPLLFGAPLPASRPGYHFEQTIDAILPTRLQSGSYRVSVQLVQTGFKSPRIPAGTLTLR